MAKETLCIRVDPTALKLLRGWAPGPKALGETVARLIYAEESRAQERTRLAQEKPQVVQNGHD